MGQRALIFTTDYELFGNGSGCVQACMIEPTERMASLLEKHGARLTVFFEVCEYWAFQKERAAGRLKEDWAALMRQQMRDLVARGHDVQLHFHPQWLEYSYDGISWQLNYDLWRIGTLSYVDADFPERGLEELFRRGKETLEQMLQPVKPDYRCEVFRAGAWSMQPEQKVLQAMRVNGFKADSTVVPGLHFADGTTFYDFRAVAEHANSYRISECMTKPDDDGLMLEIPIFAAPVPLWRRLYFGYLRYRRKVGFRPAGCEGQAKAAAGKSSFEKIRGWLTNPVMMSTFGDATVAEQMIYLTKKALQDGSESSEAPDPMVWISHPKTFGNEYEFKKYLAWASAQKQISMATFKTFIKQ